MFCVKQNKLLLVDIQRYQMHSFLPVSLFFKIRSLRTPNPVLSERLFSNPFPAVSTLQKCSTLSQG